MLRFEPEYQGRASSLRLSFWRHAPTFRDRVQVVRLWSDLWGARLSRPVRARAREGRVKSEAGFALDRAPSSIFTRAFRGGFGDCTEGRGRCGAMGLHVVKVVPLLRKGRIASRAHARDVRKTPLPDFCANLSESV